MIFWSPDNELVTADVTRLRCVIDSNAIRFDFVAFHFLAASIGDNRLVQNLDAPMLGLLHDIYTRIVLCIR